MNVGDRLFGGWSCWWPPFEKLGMINATFNIVMLFSIDTHILDTKKNTTPEVCVSNIFSGPTNPPSKNPRNCRVFWWVNLGEPRWRTVCDVWLKHIWATKKTLRYFPLNHPGWLINDRIPLFHGWNEIFPYISMAKIFIPYIYHEPPKPWKIKVLAT